MRRTTRGWPPRASRRRSRSGWRPGSAAGTGAGPSGGWPAPGARCSLWAVDEAATPDLMADTYAGLKAGRAAADALRSAQLRMIEAGEPPLHWAPFVLIGR